MWGGVRQSFRDFRWVDGGDGRGAHQGGGGWCAGTAVVREAFGNAGVASVILAVQGQGGDWTVYPLSVGEMKKFGTLGGVQGFLDTGVDELFQVFPVFFVCLEVAVRSPTFSSSGGAQGGAGTRGRGGVGDWGGGKGGVSSPGIWSKGFRALGGSLGRWKSGSGH